MINQNKLHFNNFELFLYPNKAFKKYIHHTLLYYNFHNFKNKKVQKKI